MSLATDIITALDGIASNHVYIQKVPLKDSSNNDVEMPFVCFRILSETPETLLTGDAGESEFSVVFECYAMAYTDAESLADNVRTAIEASSLEVDRSTSPGEEYILDVDGYMVPVYYRIWHA